VNVEDRIWKRVVLAKSFPQCVDDDEEHPILILIKKACSMAVTVESRGCLNHVNYITGRRKLNIC
jgi:hypothetical protein